MYVAIYGIIILVIILCVIPISSGFISALGLIFAVILIIALAKRNFDLKQKNLNQYPEDLRIIQNVREGGVIKLANVEGYVTDLELKVIGRNLYMEGDYSWYELECVRNDGEKVWVDVDDDDVLVVSVVLKKLAKSDLNFMASLETIDEEESGWVYYNNERYNYVDSGEAKFYKHCDDSKVEKLYYWDFKSANYMISVEEWKNSEGKSGYEYFYSQIIKPMAITVYSTHSGDK